MSSDRQDEFTEILAICLRYLAVREQSKAELQQKLSLKGFDACLIQRAIDRLEGEGAQSDLRFAEVFVRSRAAKGDGPHRIRQGLRIKGVIGSVVEQQLAGYDWNELMANVHAKKYRTNNLDSSKERSARMRFLAQRGFEADQIRTFFRRMNRDYE